MPVDKQCYSCHKTLETAVIESSNIHHPVDEGKCTACHSPHGTKIKFQLLNRPNELCLSCHERIITTTVRKGHIYMEEGNCLSCHTSHHSDLKGLLNDRDPALCIQCHSADTERLLKAHREPIKEISRCTSCHESHVTEKPGLLKSIMHKPFMQGDCEACHV
jgi:predicted CXXCH cytochrome family protein